MSTTIDIQFRSEDGVGGWVLLLNGEPHDGPYASLDTALEMARLETVGGPALDRLLAGQMNDDQRRILGAVEALKTLMDTYDEWVSMNHPDDHDGMSYEDFDEQRADYWESIVYQAAVVTGNTVSSTFPLSMKAGK